MSCGEMWNKICLVETFLHMINVETIFFGTIHADLSRNLLCCHLRCIGAKSILSRFTHFCVEKNLFRNCACGEKRTNIRYGDDSDDDNDNGDDSDDVNDNGDDGGFAT